ncbi:MAG TPA: phosphoethanolamine--lipid A transferase [Burkholderiales bacterium]|nr:phosphoethanolamine--lipid A transferase [Burkholderiales bacterium]
MQFPKRLDLTAGTLLASAFLVLACNSLFWRTFVEATGGLQVSHAPLYAATFLILTLYLNAILTLFTFRPLFKPLLAVLFLVTAMVAYFMRRYNVVIDAGMVQNAFETDPREVYDLLSWRMVVPVLLLGVVPTTILLAMRFDSLPFWRDLLRRLVVIAASLGVAALLLFIGYKHYAPAFREHRELRYMFTPLNVLDATRKYLNKNARPLAVAPLGTDAVRGPVWAAGGKRTVLVIVVGETARAMNFSLNGYARETNPQLARQAGLINFSNVSSCGTATAVSVPCAFSVFGREDYSDAKGHGQEGLLDVLKHAGFDVLWRDNNSGCKGTCDRVRYEDVSAPQAGDPLCNDEECRDEKLLRGLPEAIRASRSDMVIVLHQMGSHGPAYWKRVPDAFARWTPVCSTPDLAKCPTEAIVAAYDNTILYTDHVLSRTIDLLRKAAVEDRVDTAFLYFSDHGESLGEKNMYLHGAPYFMAPAEQTRVPMMLWMSDGFRNRFRIEARCIAARSGEALSHDNVFHSVLGMLDVSTAVYNPAQDMFHACNRRGLRNTSAPAVTVPGKLAYAR